MGSLAQEKAFLRGVELWRLGLYREARLEFETLRLSVAQDPVRSYQLARFLLQLGNYRSAILAARQVLELANMSDAETMGAPKFFNHLRFGTYYSDLVMPIAKEYGFHPLFLFSLLRQESLFESFVGSTAGARGLMQIMPATGADLANKLGWPPDYSDADLYRPLVSIRLGTEYLAKQREKFNGDFYAALAAYNAGPGNAEQWKAMAPDDPDLFLEMIRYVETRKYIRGIYEVFNIYRLLYDRTP